MSISVGNRVTWTIAVSKCESKKEARTQRSDGAEHKQQILGAEKRAGRQKGPTRYKNFFKSKFVIEYLFVNRNDSVDIEVDDARDEGFGCRNKVLQNRQRTEL